jgi:hypothetical protein
MIGREEAGGEMESRKAFRQVFSGSDGADALTWILNECGYFSADPRDADPLLIAFCNRLLNKIGINHAANIHQDTAARIAGANDRDLEAALASGGDDGN